MGKKTRLIQTNPKESKKEHRKNQTEKMKVKMVEINSKVIIITINEKLLTQRKPKDWRHYYIMIREMISFHTEKK